MAASNTDKFKKLTNNFSTTLSAPIVGASDTSMSLASATNLPTDTGIVLVIDRVNSSGTATPSTREYVKGTVSGSNVINLVRGIGNSTAQAHSTGAVVEQVVDQTTINDLMDGILAHSNQDGTLIGSAVRTALGQTASAGAGWTTLGVQPNTITYNGNRSYTCVFNATDQTGTLSNGMRLLLQRTVAAPTQCTSLNGTTQYYSKTGPNGMTFTDNFTVSAWIKLSSYALGSIISRYNGTSGWDFQVNASGQVAISGFNGGAANTSFSISYQSVPLNKWVHVAATLAMNTFTVAASPIYIDGVSVPVSVGRGGTNPTSLVQAGNLEIGSRNAGTQFFPGKIAQAAIYSAAISQANIAATISQGLVGTETSLISAYSFNNSINDLNANANNLTANGSAVATTADSPFAQAATAGTLEYGIITSNAFSTNTTLTVQVPEGSAIPTTGGVSAVSYSGVKVPYGFPSSQDKWMVNVVLAAAVTVTGSTVSYVNPGSVNISIPVGSWKIAWEGVVRQLNSVADGYFAQAALSTSASVVSDIELLAGAVLRFSTTSSMDVFFSRSKTVTVSTVTPYFLIMKTQAGSGTITLGYIGDSTEGAFVLKAENAYL